MTRTQLVHEIQRKSSFLCVGLDLDLDRMPPHLRTTPEAWFHFNKAIIDVTKEHCVAYKPNWAFYEALGPEGMEVLKATLDYIPDSHLVIADAKRGDIGNTSRKYAQAVYDVYGADALTVAPYMGIDSVDSMSREGKFLIILALTSNPGSADFQRITTEGGRGVYEHVLGAFAERYSPDEAMFVVGATHPDDFELIRQIIPDHFLLVPGVGAQGGTVADVARYGLNADVGLLINSTRGIIYAGGEEVEFEPYIKKAASLLHDQMKAVL